MNFFNELIVRLFAKTPWFFRVLQILSVATALITGLPEWLANSGVNLPEAWQAISNEVVSYAAMVSAFVAQLTTTSGVKKEANLKD